jgi:hypothetical protein
LRLKGHIAKLKNCRVDESFAFNYKRELTPCVRGGLLIFLLAEWGSHGIIYANASSSDGQAIQSSEGSDEDPCSTMILCHDGQRDRQTPSFSHDASQHNGFLDHLSRLRAPGGPQKIQRSHFQL